MYLSRRWYGISRKWFENDSVMTRERLGSVVSRFSLASLICLCMLTVGVGNAWGTTYNFSSIPTTGWTTSGGSKTINSISWTYSSSTYIGVTSGKIQVGSGKKPQTSAWTIQTAISNFGAGKKITAVSITAYTTNTTATYDISVGGSSVSSGSLATSSNTYSATSLNVTSGNIVVTMTGSSGSAAMYLSNISVTYEDASGTTHTLSSAVSPAASGTVSLSATSVAQGSTATATATPATHYVFDHWSISGTGSTLSSTTANPTTITMGTANTTVTATFVAAPKASITLYEAGATTTDATTYYVGDSYTLPSTTEASCGTKVLVGWSTVEVAETDTKPTSNYYEKGASVTLEASQTFYAVFATASAGVTTITKMAYGDDFEAGDNIIIVAENTKLALYQETTNTSWVSNWTFTGDVPVVADIDDEKKYLMVSAGDNEDTWKLGDATNGYLYTNTDNELYCSTTNHSNWELISYDDGTFRLTAERCLSCRTDLSSSNKNLWRGGGSSCNSGTTYYNIYKYGGGTTYSAYSTSCAACTANPTVGTAQLKGSFNLSSVGVTATSWAPGTNCSWEDYGFVWGTSANPTISDNKVQVGTSGSATTWDGALTGSFTVGATYHYRAYGKNGKASAAYYYSSDATFTPLSVTLMDYTTYATVYAASGTPAVKPEDPTKSGYTFAGWYKEAGLTNAVNWSDNITQNETYYAKWTGIPYTITLDNQDATTAGTTSISVVHGENTNLTGSPAITIPTKTGYTFGGYYTEEDGEGGQIIDATGSVITEANDGVSEIYTDEYKQWLYAGNITLHAKWTINNYTVSWSVNGSDWSGAEHGNPSTSVTYNTKPSTIPTAPDGDEVCGGKVFRGWTSDPDYSGSGEGLFMTQAGAPAITATTPFYAVFATASGGGVSFDHYEKVTSAPDDWTAYKYVIATADDGSVMTGKNGDNNYGAYATMSTTTEMASYEISLDEVSSSVYKVLQNSKYLSLSANANSLYFTDTYTGASETHTNCDWKIWYYSSGGGYVVESTKTYTIGGNSGKYRVIQFYSDRFACYQSMTQSPGYLYKRVESGSVSYSEYSTGCNKVATPKFTPAAGSYDVPQSVSISCSTPSATIYYTTDGTTPTASSNVYNGAIPVNSTTTIKAFATKAGLDDSNVAIATYTFQCSTPTFSVEAGSYNDVQSIYLATTTVGATIYYTTNGTEPTASSTRYTGSPIVLDAAGTTTIKAIAIKDGLSNSEVASATYTLTKPSGSNIVTFVTGEGNPTVPAKWSYKDGSYWYVDFPNGPTPACADDGWMFAGWATSSQTETPVAPRLHMPGDSKQITAAITFYAVYRKETTGESTVTYNASSMSSGYTEIGEDYWWLHNASGVEFYINDYALYNGYFDIQYNSYEGWALIDAHNRIKKIEFTNANGYAIDHIGNDDGTATLTTNTSTSQTVTCEGNVTQVYLYPQDPENNDYEVKLSSFTVTYYNSKFNSNPVCDPIRPEEPERLTSSDGEKVYSKELTIVCSGVEGSTLNANITGTDASMFGCELASNTITDGELTTTYRVWYQPSEANATHTATLTFQDGKSPTPNSKAITLYGRSVPAQFAIVATDGSSNSFVLDGSMTTATRPTALPVTINGSNQVENCPTRAIYTLNDLSTPDKYIHLVGPAGQLWGSTANTNGTNLSTRAAESEQTGWLLETEDFNTYHITNQAMGTRGVMLHDGVFGHYATSNYGASGYYGNLRILPIASTCTCLDAPKPTVVAKSSKAILTWAPVADAVSYTVTCSGGAVGTITGDETLTCEITGLSSNTEYTFTIKSNAASDDCSLTYNGSFTTTTCDDIPVLGEPLVSTTSATISWTCEAGTATIKVYSDAACTAQVGTDYTSKTSPFEISNLTSNTTYYYKVFAGGVAGCVSSLGYFTTEELHMDVAEWQANAVVVSYNGDADVTIYTSNEVSHGNKNANVAKDLFISKYFEAQSNVKMIGLFNGTKDTIDLSNYEIKIAQHGTSGYSTSLDWSSTADINRGRTAAQKKLPPMSEIIFYSKQTNNDKDDNIIKCAQDNPSESGWDHYVYLGARMNFNGDDPVGLFKEGTLIDIVGAGTQSGGYCLSTGEGFVSSNTDNVNGFMDSPGGWYTETGIDYDNQSAGATYALSTNRCLLIRLNTVQSGDSALKYNKTAFGTLGGAHNEWMGKQIPTPLDGSGDPDKDDVSSSCNAFEALGTYNYSDYYTAFENETHKSFEDLKSDPFDGTYTIPIPRLDTMACTQIRIELKKGDPETLVLRKDMQVPIMVQSGTKQTTDEIFHNYGKDADVCRTCDVVVFKNATLEKATDGTTGDVPEIRNLKLYEGATLSVPSGSNYSIQSLALRRKGEEISKADIKGNLNIGKTNGVSLDLYIDPTNWHFVCLPYDCNVADITFADGTPAVHRTDYFIKWYDGAYRAEHKTGGWETYTGEVLKKGIGYRIGLAGDGIIKEELRFPMANGVIADEKTNKTIGDVYAYGGDKTDTELTPNHKGWNLIGNPYMMYYATDITSPLAMGHLDESGATYTRTGSLRYLVEPINNGREGYRQIDIATHMPPFTAYFVQVGGVNNATGGDNPETAQTVTFNQSASGKNNIVARRNAPAEETNELMYPVWYGVEMIAPNTEAAKTALLISDEYTDNYDIMNDLVMQYGTKYTQYQHPLLSSTNNSGEMAYNALPDSSAAVIGVPLNYYAYQAGSYTIATDSRFNLEEVKSAQLWDATTSQYYDLLTDNYTFTTAKGKNTSRFRLFVSVERKKTPSIATGVDNLLTDGKLSLVAIDRTLVLSGLTQNADIYVYDMSGKLMNSDHTSGSGGIWRTTVPATGAYFVRVNSANGQQTLRAIVK